jgi:tetratricopeptide (TPR) repeat protein
MTRHQDYWRRAADGYRRAGLLDDACRCFEQLEDARQAALLHERRGRWARAAAWYERIPAWEDAARCHTWDGQGEAAARCWSRAGDRLRAGWALAEQARRFAQARDLLREFTPVEAGEALGLELVLARCQAGMGGHHAAASGLRNVIQQFARVETVADQQRLETWAVRLADVLQRPDLAALVYAAALQAGIPGAVERWARWAQGTLGDTTGVPTPAA